MKCYNCSEPADYLPRIKRGPQDWVNYDDLCCCENCSPLAAAEIATRAGSGHATQMIPFPRTAYQREAAIRPQAYSQRIRAKKMDMPLHVTKELDK